MNEEEVRAVLYQALHRARCERPREIPREVDLHAVSDHIAPTVADAFVTNAPDPSAELRAQIREVADELASARAELRRVEAPAENWERCGAVQAGESGSPAFDLLLAILENHNNGRDADSLGLIEELADRAALPFSPSDYRWRVEQVDVHSWRVVSCGLSEEAARDTVRALVGGAK